MGHSTSTARRSQVATSQLWVYGFIAFFALATLGVSIGGTVVAVHRRRGLSGYGYDRADLYYPDWGCMPFALAWSFLLSVYACYYLGDLVSRKRSALNRVNCDVGLLAFFFLLGIAPAGWWCAAITRTFDPFPDYFVLLIMTGAFMWTVIGLLLSQLLTEVILVSQLRRGDTWRQPLASLFDADHGRPEPGVRKNASIELADGAGHP